MVATSATSAIAETRRWVALPNSDGSYTVIVIQSGQTYKPKPKPVDPWEQTRRNYFQYHYGHGKTQQYYGSTKPQAKTYNNSAPAVRVDSYRYVPRKERVRTNNNPYLHWYE